MPVFKIPVRHAFVVVPASTSAPVYAAQGRTTERQVRTKKVHTLISGITPQFFRDYNSSYGEKRTKLEDEAIKALLRLQGGITKHKFKMSVAGQQHKLRCALGNQVDLAPMWYELSLLCQCKGSTQEVSLKTLYDSLSEGQISPSHIPCLLYMVGLCCDWLKCVTTSDHCVWSGEMLSLKILYVVSLRLYYHYLVGRLTDLCTTEEITAYQNDLIGIESVKQFYTAYPEAILQWNVAVEVGNIIAKSFNVSVKDDVPTAHAPTEPNNSGPSKTGLLPILWHTLDIWVFKDHGKAMLHSAITDLLKCDTEFSSERWLDAVLAIQVLSFIAKSNIEVLYLMQTLASGSFKPPPINPNHSVYKIKEKKPPDISDRKIQMLMATKYTTQSHQEDTYGVNVLGQQVAFKLSDIGTNDSHSLITSSNDTLKHPNRNLWRRSAGGSAENLPVCRGSLAVSEKHKDEKRVMLDSKQYVFESSTFKTFSEESIQWDNDTSDDNDEEARYSYVYYQRPDSRCTHYTHSTAPLDGGAVILGSQAPLSTVYGIHSVASIPSTIKSVMEDPTLDAPPKDLESWPWELAYVYVQCMASLVTFGDTSVIQKFALDGFTFDAPRYSDGGKGYGLQQLVSLEKSYEESSSDVGCDEFYWLVRYSAVMGLSHICRLCKTQAVKDGFSRAAWDTLMQRHSAELNEKVLDAYRLSNMFVQGSYHDYRVEFFHLPVISHIATSLAQLFLQPNFASSSSIQRNAPANKSKVTSNDQLKATSISPPKNVKAKIVTRRTKTAPVIFDFNIRTGAKLNKIAEQYWKKQMEEEESESHSSNSNAP